jgi:anti-sigma factor RsiW
MDKMKRVSVEDRDNFVAYLDGELSPDEIKKLEGILADSPVARKDVEMLVRTYELLDLLPRPQATTEFTQRTMATVKLADVKPDLTQSWWYKRAHLFVVTAAGAGLLVVSGLLGYASTNRWAPSNEELLLRDLPIIQNIDEYRQVGQHEFLERLEGQPLLMQEIQEEVRNARVQ